MEARFIGSDDPTENRVCEVFGLTFPLGDWVEVPGPAFGKLRTNPTFETRGEPEEPEVVEEPAPDPDPLDHDGDGEAGGSVAETSPKPFDDMTDEELRAFVTKRDNKAPHHMLGRTKLLDLARKE